MGSKHQENKRRRRVQSKAMLDQIKSEAGCAICHESGLDCLHFHHVHNKAFEISDGIRMYSMRRLLREVAKCVVLCANCHHKVHAAVAVLVGHGVSMARQGQEPMLWTD